MPQSNEQIFGCFHCVKVLQKDQIKSEGNVKICSICGVDAVITFVEALKMLRDENFSRG